MRQVWQRRNAWLREQRRQNARLLHGLIAIQRSIPNFGGSAPKVPAFEDLFEDPDPEDTAKASGKVKQRSVRFRPGTTDVEIAEFWKTRKRKGS